MIGLFVERKKTILFLEDEEELLVAASSVLREQGYRVVGATSAETAIEFVRKTPPDLILADIKLPGIDGLDFYQAIRKIPQCTLTPFVFLTAFNNLAAARSAKKAGASEYITKPFEYEYLVSRIRELLPP